MPRAATAPDERDRNAAIPSSTDIVRRFGYYCDEALLRPVTVERHGEPRIVMLSLREYQRLQALDHRAYYPSELPDDDFADLQRSRNALAAKIGMDTQGH